MGNQAGRLSLSTPFDCHKVVLGEDDCYFDWYGNEQHWTTRYVWNEFIPDAMSRLGIDFRASDYREVKLMRARRHDLTYHDFLGAVEYELVDLECNEVVVGSIDIIRNIGPCVRNKPRLSKFH